MDRIASSTIKGFLYQFNVTLEELLNVDNEEVFVEGRIEDIDILNEENIKAIQCKYHEAKEDYSPSHISKALLQMLKTEKEYINKGTINYKLYAYFPNLSRGKRNFSRDELEKILKTKNRSMIVNNIAHIIKIEDSHIKELINKGKKTPDEKERIFDYIKNMSNKYEYDIDIDEFLTKFEFYIGEKLEDLETTVRDLLRTSIKNVSKDDIAEIIYPNAIQEIANLSIKKESERMITKDSFLKPLKSKKRVILTRWTQELSNYKTILKNVKNRLHRDLGDNYKERVIYFDANKYEDFNDKIVIFLKDLCDKYCYKTKLHKPITICISNYTNDQLNNLISRLYSRNVKAINGFEGNKFFPESFFRKPIYNPDNEHEFKLRICSLNNMEFINGLERNKPDVIYIVSSNNIEELNIDDVKIERLDLKEFQDLYIIFQLNKGDI